MASPAAWKYSANKVLKSIIKFYVVIYKQMLGFFISFSVQFSVNILKKLNIQSSSIMQLVKTAADFTMHPQYWNKKRCKRSTRKCKRCFLKCWTACLKSGSETNVQWYLQLYVNKHKSRKSWRTPRQGTWIRYLCFWNFCLHGGFRWTVVRCYSI